MNGVAPTLPKPEEEPASGPDAPLRVLYVDDDPALGRLVQRQLGRLGFDVELAFSGEEGMARLAAETFDVVALDHYMPGQDGLDTLRAIRGLEGSPPVVYVTGTQEGRVAVAALKAGASDYVVKEIQADFVELLRAAFVAAVEQVRMRRAHDAAEAEIRAARDRFEALAAERALLLREMNHRVGNSLQIIVSLLNVQAGATEEPGVKEALDAARNRVSAVAQVHRRLYTSDQIASVALDQYLGTLLDDLQVSARGIPARGGERGVVLSLDADPVHIDPDRAVAVGIIATELVINAMKYAYPGGEGPVRVRLARQGDHVAFSVEDDGAGLAASRSNQSTGLGTRIVRAMSSKLGTEPVFEPRARGTCVRLVFPLAERRKP